LATIIRARLWTVHPNPGPLSPPNAPASEPLPPRRCIRAATVNLRSARIEDLAAAFRTHNLDILALTEVRVLKALRLDAHGLRFAMNPGPTDPDTGTRSGGVGFVYRPSAFTGRETSERFPDPRVGVLRGRLDGVRYSFIAA
jgi:hypothetical protein